MAITTRKSNSAKGKINMASDIDVPPAVEVAVCPAVKAAKVERLSIKEQNEIMREALRDIIDIFKVFDDPRPEDFGVIAQRALDRVTQR